MKAVVYRGANDLKLEDVPVPTLKSPTDALVKVTISAICGSDIHLKHGKLPMADPGTVIGHECCGVVEDIGNDVHFLKKGDRVVSQAAFSCGKCFFCKHEQPELCENGGIFGTTPTPGCQSEYVRVPFADNTLAKIPDKLTDADVIFVSDILSTGLAGVMKSSVKIGESVAVFGSGPVGLCVVACAQLFSPSLVVAVDTVDSRLDVAKKFGATAVNASQVDAVKIIMELTDGRGVDVAIEAAGFEATFNGCLQSRRRGGRMTVLGLFENPITFPIQKMIADGLNIYIGLGNFRYKEDLIKLIQAGKLDLKPIITHELPLTEAIRGYEIFEKS